MTKAFSAVLVILLTGFASTKSPPANSLLDKRCPCRRFSSCQTIFGEDEEQAYLDILEAIPQCPRFQVRCCSKDVMFETIMLLLNSKAGAALEDVADKTVDLDKDIVEPGPTSFEDVDTGRFFDVSQIIEEVFDGVDDREEDRTFEAADQAFLFFKGDPKEVAEDKRNPREFVFSSSQQFADGTSTQTGGRVECVPVQACRPENVYGTQQNHFDVFGDISPTDIKCLASEGKILCVMSLTAPNPALTNFQPLPTLTVPVPTNPFQTLPQPSVLAGSNVVHGAGTPGHSHTHSSTSVPLPCIPIQQCTEIFGIKEHHFGKFGDQQACDDGRVRCVSQKVPEVTEAPEVPVVPLPCTREDQCAEPWGIKPQHFVQFGVQPACQGDLVRCVVKREPPTQPPVVTDPPTVTDAPVFPPVTPGAPGSVQIIGPQPIYLSYNTIQGPKVGVSGGVDEAGSIVSKEGVDGSQASEIDTLLRSLRGRLHQILHG